MFTSMVDKLLDGGIPKRSQSRKKLNALDDIRLAYRIWTYKHRKLPYIRQLEGLVASKCFERNMFYSERH